MKHSILQKILTAMVTGLMLLALLGGAPAKASATTEQPMGTPAPGGPVLEVKDVNELISVIGPNVTLNLLPGEYELASAASYGKDTGNPYCRWMPTSEQGYELQIVGVDGLTLRGAGMDETTILAADRYANVLFFAACQGLTVSQLTTGHTPLPGFCSGGVLCLQNCSDVTVEGCGFFGCGTVGVWAIDCRGVTVAMSRIYECSDSAVSASGCRNVTVQDCEIDHNGWRAVDTAASSLFATNGGDGFVVTGCRIHDNTAELLLQCAYTRGTQFVSNRVEYNGFHSAFGLYGIPATVDGCVFHENYMDSWYAQGDGEATLAAQDTEGKTLDEDALSAMVHRSIELPGSEEISYREPTDVPPGGEIIVTNADEFLDAIGPDRTIVLDGDSFSLADASTYGSGLGRYYHWEECYDGPQLVIQYVSNLTIRSGAEKTVTLTATPRYADVICFQNCDHVSIAGLTLGHSEGTSECSGAVLDFEGCSNVSLASCRLYGCGTLGVNAWYCGALELTDCEIYDCSIGGVVLGSVYGVTFQDCRIHDVPSPALSLYDCSEVMWNNADVFGEHYDVSPDGELQTVVLG